MAFLQHCAYGGPHTWQELCDQSPPEIDEQGLLLPPWGDAIRAAKTFEGTYDWGSDPKYQEDGPAGQVIMYLESKGLGDEYIEAANRTEGSAVEGRTQLLGGPNVTSPIVSIPHSAEPSPTAPATVSAKPLAAAQTAPGPAVATPSTAGNAVAEPYTMEEVQRYYRNCKVKRLQQPLEDLSQAAKDHGCSLEEELYERDLQDYDDFADHCQPFSVFCDPSDLAELGSNFPLYFQFLQFLGLMLFAFFLIQMPAIVENSNYGNMSRWNASLTPEEERACSNCIRHSTLPTGLYGVAISGYGDGCSAHDWDHCGAYRAQDPDLVLSRWCCESWCWVSRKCPLATGSSEHPAYFYRYEACSDDRLRVDNCSWTGNLSYSRPALQQTPEALVPTGFPYLGSFTPGNAGPHAISTPTGSVVQFFALCFLLAMLMFQKARNLRTDRVADAKTTQPNDFAIMVEGLPLSATDERTIAEFFVKDAADAAAASEDGAKVEVVKVVIGWDLNEYNKIADRIKEQNKTIKRLLEDRELPEDSPEVKAARAVKTKLHSDLLSVGPQAAANIKSTGIAVVIFRRQQDLRNCLERWDGYVPRMFYRQNPMASGTWMEILANGFRSPELPRFPIAGRPVHKLKVRRADNPSDINWTNLGRTVRERLFRLAMTMLALTLLLVVAVIAVWQLQKLQDDLKRVVTNEITGMTELSPSGALSFLPALIITVINTVLLIILSYMTSWEWHNTKTDEQASLTFKMTLALVMTTAFVTLILNSVYESWKKWYVRGGLVEDMWWMLLINTFSQPLTHLLDTEILLKWLKRLLCCYTSKVTTRPRKVGKAYLSAWVPSDFDSTRRYAVALQTFIVCALYQPLMPQALLAGIASITLQYWVSKFMLTKVHKRPAFIEGPGVANISLWFVRLFVTVPLPLASFLFYWPSVVEARRGALVWWLILGLIVAALAIILPDSIQRVLLCTCLCCRRPKIGTEEGLCEAIDYYDAQLSWPKNMKYHKTHMLYKALPEKMNPENLREDTAFTSMDDIKDHYTEATEAQAEEDEQEQKAADSEATVMSRGGVKRDEVRPSQSRGLPVEPVSVGGAVWEYERESGWVPYNKDCQNYIERRYQDWKRGKGKPTREVRTCGKTLMIDFENMNQIESKSKRVRDVRRNTGNES